MLRLSGVVLDSTDAASLAAFYQRLLGWPVDHEQPGWVKLRAPEGPGLSFADDEAYVPPVWPASPGDQRQMAHLDIAADDLAAAEEHALACGARRAEVQPHDDVRIFLDPAGHPFCLFQRRA